MVHHQWDLMEKIKKYILKVRNFQKTREIIILEISSQSEASNIQQSLPKEAKIWFVTSFLKILHLYIAGQKILKTTGQKNSWNQINQFDKTFSSIFSIKMKILLSENGKYKKIILWNWLISFHEFFGLSFFKFSGLLLYT